MEWILSRFDSNLSVPLQDLQAQGFKVIGKEETGFKASLGWAMRWVNVLLLFQRSMFYNEFEVFSVLAHSAKLKTFWFILKHFKNVPIILKYTPILYCTSGFADVTNPSSTQTIIQHPSAQKNQHQKIHFRVIWKIVHPNSSPC